MNNATENDTLRKSPVSTICTQASPRLGLGKKAAAASACLAGLRVFPSPAQVSNLCEDLAGDEVFFYAIQASCVDLIGSPTFF